MPVFPAARRHPARPVRPSVRDPRFALLLAGQSAGWVCSWAAALVLWGYAAYRFGAGPEALSVTALCWSGPPVVLTAFTGGLADRFGPRAMLAAGYLCSAAASLAMTAAGSLAALDVTALACGAARSVCTPASGALPARVTAPEDLLAANALLGTAASAGQVAGPLLASVLMAASGFRAAFTADAVLYVVNALAVLPLPDLPAPGEPGGGAVPLRRAAGGALAVARDPGLRRVVLARTGVVFTSGAFLVAEPLYVRSVLHRPAGQFALLEAATGAGAVITGLVLAAVRRRPPGSGRPAGRAGATAMGRAAAGCGLAAALLAGTGWLPAAYAGAAVWGAAGTVFSAVAATVLQRLAPPGALGRVSGLVSSAESATEAASLPAAGAVIAVAGLRTGALLLAAVAVAAGTACTADRRKSRA